MIPALIKLRGDVDELQERMDAMKLRVESLEEKLELHRLRAQMLSAHVENLIDRVADLEGTPRPRRAWERSEPTSTDTPVSPQE